MDKKTFISKLEQSLSVLQEDELKDIISEYEQHIDMKQERGLTEEEAIADFGSLDELTGEILEAYLSLIHRETFGRVVADCRSISEKAGYMAAKASK